MVPVVGKPCMEHIVELLAKHGFSDIVVTLAFMPQAIRSYFGTGEAQGVRFLYSVEESPAGTAGSVKLAEGEFDEPLLLISGDALCDFDLSAIVTFHQEREAEVTIALKSVENPLEFGIVVTDDDGRIERFLEKPSWAQVFTDTINTGIYVINPEVLRHVPPDRPFDFAKELFPLLLEMGRPLYGYVAEGYWQDIGNLDQYRQANFDALDEKVQLDTRGVRLRGNIWLGEGVELDDLDAVEGPAFIGNYCRIAPQTSVGPYTVMTSSVTLREHAQTVRSVIDASTYLGRSSLVEGAILGKNCDIRAGARVHEGAAIGDQCTVGDSAVIQPGVRIYPFKEIESGTQVDRNVIWESRAAQTLFSRDKISGLINVDLTPEVALRVGMAVGTSLERGSRIVTSRAAPPQCRLVRRALLSGINSTGVHVADLRVLPAAVNRHMLKGGGFGAGIHVQPGAADPEAVEIELFQPPGILASQAFLKDVEKHYQRQEFRRAAWNEVGDLTFPAHAAESYTSDLLRTLDANVIRERGFKIAVDYNYSAASLVLPSVLGSLEVEAIATQGYAREHNLAPASATLKESLGKMKRLVTAAGADFGVALDQAGERIYLIDERAREIAVEQELLLFLRLLSARGRTGRLVVPVTVTGLAEEMVKESGLEIVRTPASLVALSRAASEPGVAFAGSVSGGFVFPEFLPAYDGVASLCMLLELLGPIGKPLSEIVYGLPQSTVIHRQIRCPWGRKGTVMRVLTEQLRDRKLDLTDGIKVFDERGWAQVLPDQDEPLVHLYAEGRTEDETAELETDYVELIEEAVTSREGTPAAARLSVA